MPLAATRGEFPELIISYRIEVCEQIEMVQSLNKLQSLKNDLQQNSWGAQISTNDRETERDRERSGSFPKINKPVQKRLFHTHE